MTAAEMECTCDERAWQTVQASEVSGCAADFVSGRTGFDVQRLA